MCMYVLAMGNEMVMQPAVTRNGGSTFGADSIDRGHDGGHTTVPVRKYVVEEERRKKRRNDVCASR